MSATANACRVLIVDDHADNVESLTMFVRLLGHEVDSARDGLEALEVARRFCPDLVLLDIGLPKLDGYEVAERLRAEEGGAKMVLVAITGWSQDEEKVRAQEAGFDHHLTKPVDPHEIESIIASVCARR